MHILFSTVHQIARAVMEALADLFSLVEKLFSYVNENRLILIIDDDSSINMMETSKAQVDFFIILDSNNFTNLNASNTHHTRKFYSD